MKQLLLQICVMTERFGLLRLEVRKSEAETIENTQTQKEKRARVGKMQVLYHSKESCRP
jgi:hypothetical protein